MEFRKPNASLLLLNTLLMAVLSVPGTGIWDPSRITINIQKV
jgi:hypothetical protein